MVQSNSDVREKLTELWRYSESLKQTNLTQQANLDELYSRMEKAEEKVIENNKLGMHLDLTKCNIAEFGQHQRDTAEEIRQLKAGVADVKTHTSSLDHYLDRYQPVRMANMIGETLNACLTGKERRNFEVYDAEKQSMLYRTILAENEQEIGSIRGLIHELNERAKHVIGEEEKA